MSNKDRCREAMSKLLGPVSAGVVDNMEDEQCYEKCRKMVVDFMGEAKAKEFDTIMEG